MGPRSRPGSQETILRIAYLVSQYPASSHTFIRREVDALRAKGLDIQTFSVHRPREAERTSEADRLAFAETVYLMPVSVKVLASAHCEAFVRRPGAYFSTLRLAWRHRPPGSRALLWSCFHFAEAIVLIRYLRALNIDRLHNHFANSGATVGLLATHYLEMPWSLTLHGISESEYPAGLLLSQKIEAARFVACVSWFGRAQAMRATPATQWAKMVIARCGLDLDSLRDVRAAARESSARRMICVARLSPEKGHIGLLEVFARMRADGVNAQLILVGDGPERERIERHAAHLQIEGAVVFRGRLDVNTTLAEIAASDLLVLPSFMEGLPVVLMEAMALGVAVVASRVAGVPELIDDGVEGLLFRPGDWDDLYVKMMRACADDELRTKMVEAAQVKVAGEFEISGAVDPLLAGFGGLQSVGGS